MKHTKNETIDTFFTRCLQARKEVVSNGIACTEDDLHQIFIMGLSAHSTIIQEKLDDLPDEWLDPNIHSISATAQKFFDNKMEVRNHQRTLRQTESQQPSRNNNQQQQNQNQRQQQQQRASNNNQSDNSQWDKAIWDHAIDEQRKHSIYNEIMGDIFDVGRYLHTVPQRSCLYHGIPHAGGTEQCIALQNIYTKAQMAGVSNTPIVHHLKTTRPLMPPPPYRPQTNANPRAPTPPSALRRPNTTRPPTQTQHSVHYAAMEDPLQETSIEDLHDTVEASTNSSADLSNGNNTNSLI